MEHDEDARMNQEYERQKTVEEAVREADGIILDASDGSEVMTNMLTALLATELFCRAAEPLTKTMAARNIPTAVAQAVARVEAIINENYPPDKTDAEIREYLMMWVAKQFTKKVECVFNSRMLLREIKHTIGTE
jgi:phage baseplate assembly protein W